MTKRKFLKELRQRLHQLPAAELDQILLYWSEAIDDRLEAGMTEEQIFAELDSPDAIALRILSELYHAKQAVDGAAVDVELNVDEDEDEADDDADADEAEAKTEAADDDDADDDDEDEDDDDDADGPVKLKFGEREWRIPDWDTLGRGLDEFVDRMGEKINRRFGDSTRDRVDGLNDRFQEFFGQTAESTGEERPRRRRLTANCASVREIVVEEHENEVELELAEDDQITMLWTESKYHHYETSGAGGVLSLRHQQPAMLERLFSASRREKLVLRIPAGFAGSITVTNSNASVRLTGLQCPGQVQVTTGNARIFAEACRVGSLILKTKNASITASTLQADAAELKSSNARIELDGAELRTALSVHSSNARLELRNVRAQQISAKTSNGRLQVDDIDAEQIRLESSNARICGCIRGSAGEFSVESKTSNGKNSVPSRIGGPKILIANTSNGNIELTFRQP